MQEMTLSEKMRARAKEFEAIGLPHLKRMSDQWADECVQLETQAKNLSRNVMHAPPLYEGAGLGLAIVISVVLWAIIAAIVWWVVL